MQNTIDYQRLFKIVATVATAVIVVASVSSLFIAIVNEGKRGMAEMKASQLEYDTAATACAKKGGTKIQMSVDRKGYICVKEKNLVVIP